MMKLGANLGRFLMAVVLLGATWTGCGGGGSQTAVKVVVDGRGLSAADQARVRSIWLFVTGDGDGGTVTAQYPTTGLPGGQYIAVYRPHITLGTLSITVTINDAAGAVLGTRMTTASVRKGNEVVAMVAFGTDTGQDAGPDGTISPPPTDAGAGGAGGAAGIGAGGAAAGGAGGATTDAGAVDAGMLDAPMADVPASDAPAGETGGGCNAMACSGATADACCPSSCTALNDVDCAGCGNGKLDPGETCDPAGMCPTACPQKACQLFTLMGAGTCQAACAPAGMQTMCVNGDGCCPSGCTTANDSDCSASCGNGVVEGTEICDGACPSKCLPMGCQLRDLQGSPSTCDARCVNTTIQTKCVSDDGCCPTGCTVMNDTDCGVTCGNGHIDPGETCDGNCPTSCPANGCTLRVMTGSAATCTAACVDSPTPQMACVNGDNCCPAGCNSNNDNNCKAVCGNSVLEAGETCDPMSACTTIATGCVNDANTVVTMSGSAAACTFVCTRTARTCGPVDTYCPSNVTCGPTMDSDCAGCGNGRIETGETCDPPSTCTSQMTSCVSDKDNVRTSSGSAAACTYKCTTVARTCGPADGFCPTGCGPTMDVDCAGCGNGKIEAALGETCDVAPAATVCATFNCADTDPCTVDAKVVDPTNACKVTCSHTPVTTCSLTAGDMCCPSVCNANNDVDCKAVCGNGVKEGAETCDPAAMCAMITCPAASGCTIHPRSGMDSTCNVTCGTSSITACSTTKDQCCPGGGMGACNATNDGDCAPLCGNGVLEGSETCETAGTKLCSSFKCDDNNACTTDTTTGSTATCNPVCTSTPITACNGQTKDGCCPGGCNANTDADCKAVCGNGVVENPELCDTGLAGSCPTSCPQMGCNLQTLSNGGSCAAKCQPAGTQTACVPGDGCCPANCNDGNDSDCAPKNETCATALDISQGGDFPFNLAKAQKDGSPLCTATANGMGEVYFTFTLKDPSIVYLDVYEPDPQNKNTSLPVNAAIELTFGACGDGKTLGCDPGSGQTDCKTSGAPWPRVFYEGAPAGTYFVAVRAMGKATGPHKLRFQRVPTTCIAAGVVPGKAATDTTCSDDKNNRAGVNLVTPSCQDKSGLDRTYYLEKCPDVGLSADTCGTPQTDTVLQFTSGSVDRLVDANGNASCVPAGSGAVAACNDDANPSCKDAAGLPVKAPSAITNAARSERGIMSITVDTVSALAAGCGPYMISGSVVP